MRPILLAMLGLLAGAPSVAAQEVPAVSPFIAQIAGLAVYVRAAPACGVRSVRWSRDLFDAIVGIIEQTRDGSAAYVPSHTDIMLAMQRVADAHRTGEMLVHLNSGSSCQNLHRSEGLVRADALVRRHRVRHAAPTDQELAL